MQLENAVESLRVILAVGNSTAGRAGSKLAPLVKRQQIVLAALHT